MSITPYQIVVPLVSAVAVVYAWNLVTRQKKTAWEGILWTLFWGAIAAIALKPGLLSTLSALAGFKNRENAVFVTSIGILFFMVFYIVIRLEEMEQRQTRMLRELGLKDAGVEKQK